MADNSYSPPDYRNWQVPPAAVREDIKIGFLDESVEEGQAWLKSQRGYADFRKALDTLSGMDSIRNSAPYRSRLNTNRLKRNVREVVGTLAKLRPMWGYHSDNSAYKSQAEMFNKVTKAWYLESFADRAIREALQYAAATCRGWVVPVYRRDMYGTGRGDIHLDTYGSPCVLPVQLPSSGNFQHAYTVTILDEMPVAMAHGMFPNFQHRLRPANSRFWYSNDGVRKASQGNIMQRIFGKTQRDAGAPQLSELLVPIRKTYIIDLSLNDTKAPIPMGEPGSSWSYTVPYLGQDIQIGELDGRPTYRKADENDARLYPYRRLMLSSDQCVMYDGPSFDWHGMFPGISFCVDDWPWEPLGFSLVHEGYELNEAIKEIDRGNMDKTRSQLNMSLAYDTNAVTRKEAAAFDPMQPRGRVGYDGAALEGVPFQPVIPYEVLRVEETSLALREVFISAMDDQLGVKDAMALAKMRAVGSMDDLEKIMEANGPIIEDISRTMEPPMRDLGVMVKYLILQYYTTSRVMQIVGPDGITPEVFDYDPTSLVPSHIAGKDKDPQQPSLYSARERARIFADNLRFFILPNSLHEMSQMVMKLGLIQLKKAGVSIDSQTIAEAWNLPNFGTIPGNTIIERFKQEQEDQLVFAARMKELAGGLGLLPPPGAGGAPPGAPKPGGGAPEGRPSTDAAPPTMQSKDGGARSTIATSK